MITMLYFGNLFKSVSSFIAEELMFRHFYHTEIISEKHSVGIYH